MQLRHAKLSNGLRVVAEVDTRAYSSAIGAFVDVGARHECDHEAGLSHFLEHMMFKGTAQRTAADVNRELDELGGQGNAYTSEEQTVYYAQVLPKYQDRLVDLLTDMLAPSLDENEFDVEKKVILEEIAKYDDQPPFGAFERSLQAQFGVRGLGRRVLGTTKSITGMTASTMREFFYRHYDAGNIVIAATGNVDFDALVAQADAGTDGWAGRGGQPPHDNGPEPSEFVPASSDPSQAYRIGIAPGPSMVDPDRYAMRLAATMIGDDGGSRLFWDLVDTGRVEAATIWPQEFSDCGALMTYLVCPPDDLQSNDRLMADVIATAARNGFEQDELTQCINKTVAGAIMASEDPSNRLFSLGTRWQLRQEYLNLDSIIDAYRAVDLQAVGAVAAKYLAADWKMVTVGGAEIRTLANA